MKILFYIENLGPGGKERRLVELIKGLSKYPDIEMELVLISDNIHYRDIFATGIKINFTIRKGLKKDPKVFSKFYKIAKQFKPDIIHVWGGMSALYAIPTKLLLSVPMINNQIADAPIKVSKGILSHKSTFLFSDKLIANTTAGLKSYSAPSGKSKVIYNGFEFNRINNLEQSASVKNKFGIKTKYVVGMIATFYNKKDYATYINAANDILNSRNDVTFICVGDGDSSKDKELVKKGNQERILFLGKQKNVESIMNICDIGVLTSNIKLHGEGISNALLEFSSLAKPILATNNGGTPEIIENGKNGFLLTPFSHTDLSEKISLLLDNDDKRFTMGAMAKKIVERKFGIDRMVKEFYESYKEVLQ